jgi:hypothetical protein
MTRYKPHTTTTIGDVTIEMVERVDGRAARYVATITNSHGDRWFDESDSPALLEFVTDDATRGKYSREASYAA